MTTVVEQCVSEEHSELFHYTSINALGGILESNSLWATHATHLNDSSEMTILWPMLEEQCIANLRNLAAEYLKDNPDEIEKFEEHGGVDVLAEKEGRMIVSKMRENLFGAGSQAGLGVPFIVSFTKHCDEYQKKQGMLSQWRGYGGEGNVAIIFNVKELERLLGLEAKNFQYMSCSISDVIYYREGEDIVRHLPNLFHWLNEYIQEMRSGWDITDEKFQDILGNLTVELLPAVGRIKHQAFSEENECRIVVGIPDESHRDKLEALGDGDVQMKKVHFRPGSVESVPYIKLFEKLDEKLPIRRIIVGPSRNQKANEYQVHQLIRKFRGADTITIQCSDISFVGSA